MIPTVVILVIVIGDSDNECARNEWKVCNCWRARERDVQILDGIVSVDSVLNANPVTMPMAGLGHSDCLWIHQHYNVLTLMPTYIVEQLKRRIAVFLYCYLWRRAAILNFLCVSWSFAGDLCSPSDDKTEGFCKPIFKDDRCGKGAGVVLLFCTLVSLAKRKDIGDSPTKLAQCKYNSRSLSLSVRNFALLKPEKPLRIK